MEEGEVTIKCKEQLSIKPRFGTTATILSWAARSRRVLFEAADGSPPSTPTVRASACNQSYCASLLTRGSAKKETTN
ncbi:hypothetical protein Y032_0355g3324 [Ancylostoma ceylanicum]|uniref:Uncharacterized protein n=1 Tax=Ancylostoma ceylanicum TaxID=53326 RepID=A0A016RWE8_9BILA|nr:hypothetical protein Y032_0355g3324 [Ancylostoma ceylanicum]